MNMLVRIYAVVTLCLLGWWIYQKNFVTFDDIIEFTPLTFLQNEYINVNSIDYYSFAATTVDNASLTIRKSLFCRNNAGLWELELSPDPDTYPMKLIPKRLETIREINNQLSDNGLTQYTADNVELIREYGDALASIGGFAFADNFDISRLNATYQRTCKLKLYYETETRFFNITKAFNYFSHPIKITHTPNTN